MKRLGAGGLGLGAFLVLAQALGAQSPTSVTLFNSGRVLVRRSLPVAITSGVSTHTLTLGQFIASTFEPLDPGISLVGITSDLNWSEDALLRRNVGQSFTIEFDNKPARTAKLLSLDPERWEWPEGGVVFGRPGKLVWLKSLIPTDRVVDVTVASDKARSGMNVMYETSGGYWTAYYRVFLGSAGRIEGVASLSGGTLDLQDVEVQLLAGNIGNASLRSVEGGMAMTAQSAPGFGGGGRGGAPVVESIGESRLYTLPHRLSFASGLQHIAPLFDPIPVKAERRFTVSGALQYYGGFSQNEDEQTVPVNVAYRSARKLGTSFGDVALPAGTLQLFDIDKAGRPQLIGQGTIAHTAPGQELMVESGTAFDVTAKRVQTDYSATSTVKPARTTAIAGYRVTLQNAKDTSVVVEVREDRGGDWSVIESSVPAEKRSSTRMVFPVTVPAKGSVVLTYRVRVVW